MQFVKKSQSKLFEIFGLFTAVFLLAGLLSTPAQAVTNGQLVPDPKASAPYVVSIWTTADSNDYKDAEFLCTGTLIGPQVVLTAAHCTTYTTPYFVKVGAESLNDQTAFTQVSAVWTSPRYNPKTFTNDVGLLKLTDRFENIEFPTLASPNIAKSINKFSKLQIFGWGLDQNEELAELLRVSNLTTQDALATKVFGKYFNSKTMISAGRKIPAENVWSGACSGDSGGPLLSEVNNINVIVGITSWGAKKCLPNKPSIFARVSYYEADIKNGIKALETQSRVVDRTAPVATTEPSIIGQAKPGSSLKCSAGTWKNALSVTSTWISPARINGSTNADVVVQASDGSSVFKCEVIISSAKASVRRVLTTSITGSAVISSNPVISGISSSVVKSGTIARCEGWNWKSPVDNERVSWFTSSSAQPTVPVNGRQIGSGPSLTLDSSMLRGENGRYLICQVTGSKDGFEAHFTASKYLTTPAAPTLSYVSINASSLTTGGNATCSFNSYSENESTRVDWGYTSVSGYFTLYPGLSGEKIQITRDLAQQAAGKYLACRVTLINSGGEVSKSANTYNTFASLPNAPSVSVSINGAVSAGSTARCSASASYDFGTNLTYAWGKTSSNGSRSIEGEVYSRSTSYTLTSSSLDNLAGAFLTCVVTLENDVGSVSSASSISIPNSQITIPQPTAPTVETQTASSTSISVKIRVPSISGFDGSKMVAKLNVVNAPNCTNLTVNPGSTYDCAGLSANTTYTANISVASISGQVVQKTSSNLSFTTIGLGSLQTPAAPTFTPISPTEVRVALPGIPGFNSSTMSAQLYIYYQTSLSALGIDGAASTVTVRELAAGKTHTGYIVLRSLISGSEVKSSVVTFTLLSGATINPTFSSTTSTLDGFTFQITNYDSTYTWSASVEASSQPGAGAAISNSGLVRISGMTANASANIIVRASKAGIDAGSNSISGRSLNSTDNQLRVLVSDPDSSGVSNISFCFTNPESLSGYVNWTSPQIGSGSFLKHSGTPACPNPAGVSVGQRLTAATTYTFSVSASNNGRNYSDSVTITTPGDRQPPTISSGTVAPSSISVGQNITVRFRATDQVRVSSCRATVYNRNNIDTVTNSSCSKVSGDELDGIWQVSINLNSSNGPGAYTVKASATDSSGNTSLLTEVGTFSIAGPSVSNLGTLPTPRTIGINYVDQIVLNGFNLGSLGVDPGGYIWTVRIQNSSNQFVKTEPVGSNQTYITGLAGGTTYNVYLVATDSAGATKLSLPLAVTTLAPAWTPPADSNTAIYDDTYTRICLSQNWTNCGSWTIYNETGMVVNRIVGPIPFTFCQTSGVNVCGGSPKGFAVLTGRYYAPIPAAPSLWKESYPLNGSVIPPGRGGTWEIGVTGATTLSLIASSPDAPSIVANFSQSWGGNVVISTASYANQPGVLLYKGAIFVPSGTPNTTFTLTWTATNSAGTTTTFTGGTFRTSE